MARDAEANHRTAWAVEAEGQLRQVCRELRAQVLELQTKRDARLAAVKAQHAKEVAELRATIARLESEQQTTRPRILKVAGGSG